MATTPDWMSPEAIATLGKSYLLPGESPKDMWWRVANNAEKILDIQGLAEDLFEIFWKGYLGLATPVATNFGAKRGLPVSCYSLHISDSLNSIYSHLKEASALSKYGGGVGAFFGDIRCSGSPITDGGVSSGVVSWMQQYDLAASKVSQGGVRRGNFALYLPISHPDLLEVLRSKDHSQGDPRQFIDSNIAVTITDSWMQELLAGDLEKKKIFSEVLKTRLLCGSPYIVFIDTVNRDNPDCYKERGLEVSTSNLCSEITLYTDENHTFVCVLSSLNLALYDIWKHHKGKNTGLSVPELGIYLLDAVNEEFISRAKYMPSMGRAVRFASKSRALGLGTMGLHALYQSRSYPFMSKEARELNNKVHEFVQTEALKASRKLAKIFGEPEWCKGHGVRNSHLTAIAPTRTNSVICGAVSPGIEPMDSNYYVAKQAKGTFVRKNPYLEKVLEKYGKNTSQIWDSINSNKGGVQHLQFLSPLEKEIFKTAREINQFEIVKQAADRQKFIDQSQSLNIWIDPEESAENIFKLHLAAWMWGVKSLYYVRSESLLLKRNKQTDNILVSKDGCPYCEKAKALLNSSGIKFKIFSKDQALKTKIWDEKLNTFPQVHLDGHYIGGYTELAEYILGSDWSSESSECLACDG